jgi:hypothetical protein
MRNRVYKPANRNMAAAPYDEFCPKCCAQPGHLCRKSNGDPCGYVDPHKARGKAERERMPDLSGWWHSVREYEGRGDKRRPVDLVIP